MGFKSKRKLILFRLPTFALKNLETKWPLSWCSSQWPRYSTWHCPMPWCTTTPNLVILLQMS